MFWEKSLPNSRHKSMNERFVVYTVAGTIALTPIVVAGGPRDQVKADPIHQPHAPHADPRQSEPPPSSLTRPISVASLGATPFNNGLGAVTNIANRPAPLVTENLGSPRVLLGLT